mgnify:CR=1 FL=1
MKRLAHKARALEVIKLPENASANDIFNSFTPSVIKGGLDKSSDNKSSEISILGSIAAGTPIEAIQQEVDRVALPENLQNNGEHYGLKVKGDSMIEAGINDGLGLRRCNCGTRISKPASASVAPMLDISSHASC